MEGGNLGQRGKRIHTAQFVPPSTCPQEPGDNLNQLAGPRAIEAVNLQCERQHYLNLTKGIALRPGSGSLIPSSTCQHQPLVAPQPARAKTARTIIAAAVPKALPKALPKDLSWRTDSDDDSRKRTTGSRGGSYIVDSARAVRPSPPSPGLAPAKDGAANPARDAAVTHAARAETRPLHSTPTDIWDRQSRQAQYAVEYVEWLVYDSPCFLLLGKRYGGTCTNLNWEKYKVRSFNPNPTQRYWAYSKSMGTREVLVRFGRFRSADAS
ncbi:MAG: hypothetical protein M1840_004518 [Geoglossum simile]|nr:MAG: hypothetical protein M1840_004518 [Geoglossum simile]